MRQVVESLRAARRALRYVGPAYRRAQRVDLLKQRLRWPVLAALEPRATLHWFERCARAPLAAAVRLQPLLPLKPLRPYLSMRWNRRQRMRVIEHSWKLLLGGPAALREAVATPGGRRLAQVTVGGEALELRLGTNRRFRKEGEIALSLCAGSQGEAISSVALSFESATDGWRAYVGCLQGARGAREMYGRLTKALHGMRPTYLLVFATQELVRVLGVQRLLAAGGQIQVHRSKHLLHVRRWHALSCNYDRTWLEAGGSAGMDGWFTLPLQAARRSHAQQASHKRAMYARRYSLMEEIATQIRFALHGIQPG